LANSTVIAIATGPVILCVKFVLYYMQGWVSECRCPWAQGQTLRKRLYILRMLYRNFIRWKQVKLL